MNLSSQLPFLNVLMKAGHGKFSWRAVSYNTFAPIREMTFSPRTCICLLTSFWQLNLLQLCNLIKYHTAQ